MIINTTTPSFITFVLLPFVCNVRFTISFVTYQFTMFQFFSIKNVFLGSYLQLMIVTTWSFKFCKKFCFYFLLLFKNIIYWRHLKWRLFMADKLIRDFKTCWLPLIQLVLLTQITPRITLLSILIRYWSDYDGSNYVMVILDFICQDDQSGCYYWQTT